MFTPLPALLPILLLNRYGLFQAGLSFSLSHRGITGTCLCMDNTSQPLSPRLPVGLQTPPRAGACLPRLRVYLKTEWCCLIKRLMKSTGLCGSIHRNICWCSLCRCSLLLLLPPDLEMTYAFRDSWNDCNNNMRAHEKRSKAAEA